MSKKREGRSHHCKKQKDGGRVPRIRLGKVFFQAQKFIPFQSHEECGNRLQRKKIDAFFFFSSPLSKNVFHEGMFHKSSPIRRWNA